MRGARPRFHVKSVVAILCTACFLAASMGSVTRAVAADDTFETWPKKPAPGANGAAQAGDTAGTETSKGMSAGKIGLIALGAAAVVGIAVAAGGGGGSSSSPACNQ